MKATLPQGFPATPDQAPDPEGSGAIPLREVVTSNRIEHTLFDTVDRCPEQIALVGRGETWTYAQLAVAARAAATAVARAGVEPGDRVVLYGRKSLHWVAALYGAWTCGAVAVPASSELRADQLSHIVCHSGACLLVGDERLLAALPDSPPARAVGMLALFENKETSSAGSRLSGGDETAALIYTSGSTGLPKGIEITHDNLRAGARIVSRYLQISRDDRVLSVLPFHFDYGLNQLLTTVREGATLVLQPSTHPGAIVHALKEHRITGLAGVPPLWVQLMAEGSPLLRTELPQLRYVTNSGGAFPVDLLERYVEALPRTDIFLMYGLSEAFRSSYLPPSELSRRPTSMGRAIPETELFVVDADGREAADDMPGQLVHRGPTVAKGYYRDPETTARTFRDDPFDPAATRKVVYSGDEVRRDSEGFLYFVGRSDQQLKSFGHRVSPEEVELQLRRSGLVELAVVGGKPDRQAGQAIVAHVVPSSAQTTPEALERYCRDTMPRYMQPAEFHFHERFPLTSSGKLDRKRVLA